MMIEPRAATLRIGTTLLIGLLIFGLTGCPEQPGDDSADDPADRAPGAVREGLSPEELEQRAEPIPPEEARRRGMIDTTIYVEEDLDIDTVFDPDGP